LIPLDGQTDVRKLIDAFLKLANAPKKGPEILPNFSVSPMNLTVFGKKRALRLQETHKPVDGDAVFRTSAGSFVVCTQDRVLK